MKSASTLSNAFLQPAGQALPAALLTLRFDRASALADLILPTRKTENWKYSAKHLKLTDDMASTLPMDASAEAGDYNSGYTVVMVNGVVRPDASNYPTLEGLSIQRFGDLSEDDASVAADMLSKSISDQPAKSGSVNM